MRHQKRILIILATSLVLTLLAGYFLRAAITDISKDYIEFVIGLSITMAGFGLVAFQIAHASDELKKDFIESSILMVLASLISISFWVYPEKLYLAVIGSMLFLWGMILLLIILLSKRFNIIK